MFIPAKEVWFVACQMFVTSIADFQLLPPLQISFLLPSLPPGHPVPDPFAQPDFEEYTFS